jgi:hypothetical protein
MTIGQNVYLEPKNNAARYNKEIKKCTVSKIGRKYFEVDEMNTYNPKVSHIKEKHCACKGKPAPCLTI